MITKAKATEAQGKLEAVLAGNELTNGIGLMRAPDGSEDWCIIVYLLKKAPAGTIHAEIDGVGIITQVTGSARARA